MIKKKKKKKNTKQIFKKEVKDRLICIENITFLKSAVEPSQYVVEDKPFICFVGKSNVGKSTLINTITNKKRMAKTSKTPGCTQLVNFFDVDNRMILVDLPGYGYAKVAKNVKKTWPEMMDNFFSNCENLMRAFLILDIRRKVDEQDFAMMNIFDKFGIPVTLIINKIDKIKKTQLKLEINRVRNEVNALYNKEFDVHDWLAFSSLKKQGIDELIFRIENLF